LSDAPSVKEWNDHTPSRRRLHRPRKRAILLFVVPLVVLLAGSLALSGDLTLLDPEWGLWTLTQPWGNETITLSALHSAVTVIRDGAGTIHIYAQDDQDLAYAQGYTEASDRLFQMEAESLEAQGNISQWVGSSGIDSDIAFRTLGLPQSALEMQAQMEAFNPTFAQTIESFCDGVNAYISWAESADHLPLEFQTLGIQPYTWTPADLFAFERLMVFSQTTGVEEPLYAALATGAVGDAAVNQLYPVYPQYWQNFTVLPGNGTIGGTSLESMWGVNASYVFSQDWLAPWATGISTAEQSALQPVYLSALDAISDPYFPVDTEDSGSGSNSWVVAANHSVDGLPMVANDPHLPIMLPSLWIPTQLVDPDYDVEGWALAGLPGILIGHDQNLAWALTNSEGDTAMEYVLTLQGNSYLQNGTWHPLTTTNETLQVSGGSSQTLTLQSAGGMPILGRDAHYGIALLWAADHPTWEAMAEMLFDRAVSISQFFQIMQNYWSIPNLNVLVAEDNSTGATHIGWLIPCHYPLVAETLPDGSSVQVVGSRVPLNGSAGFYPVGDIPQALEPESVDPAQGYLYAPNQPTVGQDYPYPFIGSYWDSGGRGHAIGTFLGQHPMMSVPLMEELQANVTDQWAVAFTPELVHTLQTVAASSSPTASLAQAALPYAEDWNGSFDIDEVAPSVYTYWYNEMVQTDYDPLLWQHGIGGAPDPFPNAYLYLAENDPSSSWFPGGWAQFSVATMEAALSFLEHNLSAMGRSSVSSWTWGVVHTFTLPSLDSKPYLADGPYPHWGDGFTVSVAPSTSALTLPLTEIALGSSLREVSEPNAKEADGGTSAGIIPGGASGDPASPYYDDQLPLWLAHEYVDMTLVPKDTGPFPQNVVSTWTLQP
jgi:penicillin G amidase